MSVQCATAAFISKISANFRAALHKLIARKSAGIRTVGDLKGKRIGLAKGAAGQYFLDLAALTGGIDPREMSLVGLDLTKLAEAASNHQIDAFSLWEPGARKLTGLLGEDALRLKVPTLYTLTFNLIALRGKESLAEDDQLKFLRALDKAMTFIQAEPARARALLQERLKLDTADVDAFWPDYHFNLSLNQSLLSTLESEARWALREALVKDAKIPNYLNYLEVGPLRRVKSSAVTLVK